MEEMKEESAVAWSWVIEALARSDAVDVALLYELGPQVLGYSGIAAREAAALRCLDSLSAFPLEDDHLLHLNLDIDNTTPFRPSHTCQHVLHCFLNQTVNLRKPSSQDYISTLQTFVNHKKSSFPTSTLELLKNLILEGNHSILKEQITGLPLQHQCVPSSNPSRPVYPHSTTIHAPHSTQTSLYEPQEDIQIPNASSEQSKRGTTNACSIQNHMHGMDSASQHGPHNLGPPAKKLKLQKQCGIQSSEKTVAGQPKSPPGTCNIPPDTAECCNHDTSAAMNKDVFSSSNAVFGEDSITLTDTEEANLCMKCNEGGQLLACHATTCPLLFHQTCLGCFISFDDQGNFYCPICAYSRAVSEYMTAKQKVSLARKELALFIGGGSNYEQKLDSTRSSNHDVNQQRGGSRENADDLQNGAGAPTVAEDAKSH